MANVLCVYSTVDGHTVKICRRLQTLLAGAGHRAQLIDIAAVTPADLAAADVIVVGASIRYGRHRPAVLAFVARHLSILTEKPSAFFSVNVVARKPGKDRAETNPYVRALLRRSAWRPTLVDVFAGRIDYQRYGWFDRQMIRFIMWLTKGPTDPHAVVEFTDWRRVEAFGQAVIRLTVAA